TVQCLDYPLSLTVVVDAANGPLAGAKVRVEGPITVEGTTNGEGRCMLSNLVAGSYYVSVFYGDSLVSSRWIHLGSDTTIHLHIDAYLIGSFQLSPHLLQVCIYTVLFAIALLIFWNRSRVVDLLKRLKR
ncbi:carboxypeptidase regulatory-like domain-containing protein, partial [archaeon]|nr:carboxypeptidase regulatory-like domain-containing protein [archaeon]